MAVAPGGERRREVEGDIGGDGLDAGCRVGRSALGVDLRRSQCGSQGALRRPAPAEEVCLDPCDRSLVPLLVPTERN